MISPLKIMSLSVLLSLLFAGAGPAAQVGTSGGESKLDERINKTISEIEKLNDEWSELSSLDRIAAIMAVNPVEISTYPHREDSNAERGPITGDMVAMSVQGKLKDVITFLESIETNRHPLIVESARVRYIPPDSARADIRIFAAKKIRLPTLPDKADGRVKEMFFVQLDGILEEALNLKHGRGVPFRFFEDAWDRWPIGFPELEEISFENDAFNVHTKTPLSRPDPLVGELARELSGAAGPIRVNLAPLVGPLIKSGEIESSAGTDGFTASWRGLKIVELKGHEIISYLVGEKHIFVIYKNSLSAKKNSPKDDETRLMGCVSELSAYDIAGGALLWEHKYPGCGAPFTNMVLDSAGRLLLGRGFTLTAIEPDTGRITKRWPLSVRAMDLALPREDTIAVYGQTPHGNGMREYIENDARKATLMLRAAPRSADELHGITLSRLTDKVSSTFREEKYDDEIIMENMAKATGRIRRLSSLDGTNPWYPFFRGMIETLNGSENAAVQFRNALNIPLENPFHYLEMGRKLERLEFYGLADEFYEKAFAKFLKWYRPAEIPSPFTGFIYFVTPANRAIEQGEPGRVPALMKWLGKFQPFAQKTDLVELEMAARFARDGQVEESARAMERYRRCSSKSFGIGLNRMVKAAAVGVAAWVAFAVFVIFWLAMVFKYRCARARAMAEAGWPDLKSRLVAITEPPGNFLRFHTLTFATPAEKLTALLLWTALLLSFALTVINGQIMEKKDDFLLLADYNSPGFVDIINQDLKAGRTPENLFLLGLARQMNGKADLARSHYHNAGFAVSDRKASARAINNLGVLRHETGTESGYSPNELFKKAVGKDPWLPEALYNLGVEQDNEAYKQRAVEYGLEREYRMHYPDRPVRAGPDARMIARLVTGYRIDMLRDLASNWARVITGDIAWKSGNALVVAAYYLLLLAGLALVAGAMTPSRRVDSPDIPQKRWWRLLPPGLEELMRGRPLLGAAITALFLFSFVILGWRALSGVALIPNPSAIKFPLEYSDLPSATILAHEPTIKGITLFSLVAFFLSIACHSAWLLVTRRKNRLSSP